MKTLILLFGFLIMTICPSEADQSVNDPILLKNEVYHYFSSSNEKDLFQLHLWGKSIVAGKINLRIKTKDGRVIFNETYPSSYLLDYSIDSDASIDQKEKYIKKRLSEFFPEDSFRQPAIDANEQFDEDYSDYKVWMDIKSDKTAIGFRYLLGGEDTRHIAYSKKTKKTVLYFNCC